MSNVGELLTNSGRHSSKRECKAIRSTKVRYAAHLGRAVYGTLRTWHVASPHGVYPSPRIFDYRLAVLGSGPVADMNDGDMCVREGEEKAE